MLTSKSFSRGFTLIELLVVITIIVVLAAIAYPGFASLQERARVAQDMSNLRQLGLAAQMYMNDNDGVIFSTDSSAGSWMKQLQPKYLPAWKIFQSPFDQRSSSEIETSAPVSYGLNGHNIIGTLADKISVPSAFILFAPAQDSTASAPKFQGSGNTSAPGVTVYKAASTPGGTAPNGTHSSRKRINALFTDLHSENILWTTFVNDSPSDPKDPSAAHRWDP